MLRIYLKSSNNRLYKCAYSKNDYTIPNNLCINDINMRKQALNIIFKLQDVLNIPNIDENSYILNQLNCDLIYNFNTELGNIGLLCITGKLNNIITKFEFYVQFLTAQTITNALNKLQFVCINKKIPSKRVKILKNALLNFLYKNYKLILNSIYIFHISVSISLYYT